MRVRFSRGNKITYFDKNESPCTVTRLSVPRFDASTYPRGILQVSNRCNSDDKMSTCNNSANSSSSSSSNGINNNSNINNNSGNTIKKRNNTRFNHLAKVDPRVVDGTIRYVKRSRMPSDKELAEIWFGKS